MPDNDALLTAATAREVKLRSSALQKLYRGSKGRRSNSASRERPPPHAWKTTYSPRSGRTSSSSYPAGCWSRGPPPVRHAQEASPSEVRRYARGTGDQTPGALAPTTGGSTSLCRLPGNEGSDEGAAGGWHYPDVGLLRVLWLLRLPDDVRRGITDFSGTPEDELTKLADALQGADRRASARTAMATTHVEALPPPEEPDDEDMAAAAPSQPRRWPQMNQRRPPPHQPPRGTPPRKAAPDSCFFHSRFGHDARNCRLPCSWAKN